MYVKKIASTTALALAVIGPAAAQNAAVEVPKLNFQSSNTWNTVLLVSAIVGVVGVVQGDSTLTILGAAGVIFALTQQNKSGFQFKPSQYGLGLANGPISFNLNPLGGLAPAQPFSKSQPTASIIATFKF